MSELVSKLWLSTKKLKHLKHASPKKQAHPLHSWHVQLPDVPPATGIRLYLQIYKHLLFINSSNEKEMDLIIRIKCISSKNTILLHGKLDCSFLKRVRLQKEFALFGYFTKPQVAIANNGDHIKKGHRLMSQLTFQPADTGLLIGQWSQAWSLVSPPSNQDSRALWICLHLFSFLFCHKGLIEI